LKNNRHMKSIFLKSIAAGIIATLSFSSYGAFEKTVPTPIWPSGKMPEKSAQQDTWQGHTVKSVKTPTLEVYLAKSEKPNGLVVICPGGGYYGLAYDHEGWQIAEWFNKQGISAAILKYRVPNYPDGALMDAQRAIRIVRANAAKWNVNPNKIGILGFSAGANLSARASTNFASNSYSPVDDIDKLSARPDATCLVYPAYCDKQGNDKRWNKKDVDFNADLATLYAAAENLNFTKDMPPVFITQSLYDKNYINSGIAYFLAAKKAGVKANLHVFEDGGHGYGLAKGEKHEGKLYPEWAELAEDWFKANGFSDKD